MAYFLFALALFIIFMSGIWVVKKFKKKYNPNRWVVAFIGPFILILPLIFSPELPSFIWAILIIIFMWTNIYFFETTRKKLEEGEIKTVFNSKKAMK